MQPCTASISPANPALIAASHADWKCGQRRQARPQVVPPHLLRFKARCPTLPPTPAWPADHTTTLVTYIDEASPPIKLGGNQPAAAGQHPATKPIPAVSPAQSRDANT